MNSFEENTFFPFDQRSEYENEYSYINESSNTFQLFPLQNEIMDFNDFQFPIPELTTSLNEQNDNNKDISSQSDSSKQFLSKKKRKRKTKANNK